VNIAALPAIALLSAYTVGPGYTRPAELVSEHYGSNAA